MFNKIYNNYPWEKVSRLIYSSTEDDVKRVLAGDRFNADSIYPLFSPAADTLLERMAELSYRITRQRFGNAIQLYVPLYISNECGNICLYCGFNASNKISRKTLTTDEILKEAEILYRAGFRHILLLTGEKKSAVPLDMLEEAAALIHKKFSSVSIEVYPMEEEEYRRMVNAGVDGLTLYQETYNRDLYDKVHLSGEKKDFYKRLSSPDLGGRAGFRRIGVGSLLGLADWRVDGYFTALHALYLTGKYWKSQVMVSFPRIRHATGDFAPPVKVTDRDLAHLIAVMRIVLNDAALVLSTREPAPLRDNLFPLGITTMSAGSKTSPGGYTGVSPAEGQFDIEDTRSPLEIASIIKDKGYDPVWKDWDRDFLSN
jgi:2-iminoacetate synthase